MKLLLLSFFVLGYSFFSFAQVQGYYYLKPGTEMTMTVYNIDKKLSGKVVLNVYATNENTSSPFVITTTTYDNEGSIVYKTSALAKYNGSSLFLGLSNFVPELPSKAKIKFSNANNAWLEYPEKLKVGSILPDGWLRTNYELNGSTGMYSVAISNRRVIGKDTVSLGDSSVEAYKISYKYSYIISTINNYDDNSTDVVEWFVPGYGIIKSQTKNGFMELASR